MTKILIDDLELCEDWQRVAPISTNGMMIEVLLDKDTPVISLLKLNNDQSLNTDSTYLGDDFSIGYGGQTNENQSDIEIDENTVHAFFTINTDAIEHLSENVIDLPGVQAVTTLSRNDNTPVLIYRR